MLTIQPENFDWTMAMLSNVEKTQLPFAVANAINRTLEEAQTAMQDHLSGTYTIRRPWVLQGIKIDNADRATKDNPRGVVHLDPARGFLAKFQDGGSKVSRRSGGRIAVPGDATRNKSGIIPDYAKPKAFLLADPTRADDRLLGKGKQHTFLVRGKNGDDYLLQRVGKRSKVYGKGRSRDPNVKLLWIMVPSARIPANLEFYQIGEATVHERWLINMQGMLAYALKTAKP